MGKYFYGKTFDTWLYEYVSLPIISGHDSQWDKCYSKIQESLEYDRNFTFILYKLN